MAYEVVMPYHLHMPSYFLETFTEYPFSCGRLLRPTTMGYTSCYSGTYVLLQWNVRPAAVGRNNRT